jgi:hypothetical protein
MVVRLVFVDNDWYTADRPLSLLYTHSPPSRVPFSNLVSTRPTQKSYMRIEEMP